jgi:hypothetical protein
MMRPLWGLNTAIRGLGDDYGDNAFWGVMLIAEEACEQMKACADAFEAERKLRMTPEERARFERGLNMVKEEDQ